jgi:hypothetical protein
MRLFIRAFEPAVLQAEINEQDENNKYQREKAYYEICRFIEAARRFCRGLPAFATAFLAWLALTGGASVLGSYILSLTCFSSSLHFP